MNVSRDDNGDIKLDSQDHSISFSFNRQITPEDKKSESTNKMISDVMNTPRSKKQVPMRELVLKTVEVFEELTNKLNRCNKHVKLVLEILQKLQEATEKKTTPDSKDTRDGTYENKRNVYLTKQNNKEIKQRKQTTLQYYRIDYDENTEAYS